MKKLGFVLLLLISGSTYADSVVVNGINYSCTNTCVVTVTSDGWSVEDSDGGTVTMTFDPK